MGRYTLLYPTFKTLTFNDYIKRPTFVAESRSNAAGQCGQASPIPGPLAGLQERDGIRQAKGTRYGLAAFLRLVVGRASHPNIGGALGVFRACGTHRRDAVRFLRFERKKNRPKAACCLFATLFNS